MPADSTPGPEPKRRSTMVEVAAAAGVSQTTVSLVLNGAVDARLSDQTRQRVLQAARALDYRLVKRGPSVGAQVDKTVVAMVVDELSTDPWMALAIDGIREKAWEHGLTVSVATTRGDAEMQDAALAAMLAQPTIGLIYGTIQTRQVADLPSFHLVPTVLLNCHVAARNVASIVPGEVLGGRAATERLIESGHRRIGLIEGEVWMEASRDRQKGYRQALASHDIAFDPDLVRPGNWEPSAGFEQTHVLMRLARPPTAIFCANDMMATGCYEALKEMGRRIPDDVAVVGYDDREVAQFARPPLTTVLLPHLEMGTLAAEYLIDHFGGLNRKPVQTKVECRLIERQSVQPTGTWIAEAG